MDVAKSLFKTRDHAGYVGKSEHAVSSRFIRKSVNSTYTRIFFSIVEKFRFC